MTQYFFVDESGDPGLEGQASSSSHFVVTMVQLPARIPLYPLVNLRKALQVKTTFEFKYHTATRSQKDLFFREILHIPFRVRAVAFDKTRIGLPWINMKPSELMTELIIRLTLRTDELDIANEILIIDGATPTFCRHLHVQFRERCRQQKRIRPFKNIIGANSRNEDGLQLADMIAGAIRLYKMGISGEHFYRIASRVVDFWQLP